MSPPSSRVKPAFGAMVFVASAINGALMTASMAGSDPSTNTPMNGFARFVMLSLLGLPFAATATLGLGVPAYLLARATVGVNAVSAIVAGGVIGVVVSVVFAAVMPGALIARFPAGVAVGAISGAVWWLLASSGEAPPAQHGPRPD